MGIFKAFNNKDNQIYDVYAVRSDSNGFAQFLIYGFYHNRSWNWVSAKWFVPIED